MKLIELYNHLSQNRSLIVNAAFEQIDTDSRYSVRSALHEIRVNMSDLTEDVFIAILDSYQVIAQGSYIDASYDSETSECCFRLSQVVEDRDTAIRLARFYGEKSVTDLSNGSSINL